MHGRKQSLVYRAVLVSHVVTPLVLAGCDGGTPATVREDGKLAEAARAVMKRHSEQFDSVGAVKTADDASSEADEPYNRVEYAALERIARDFHGTPTHVTALLRMAELKSYSPRTKAQAEALLDEIIKVYPDSWQAVYATWMKGRMLIGLTTSTKEEAMAVIRYDEQNLDLYRRLDGEKDDEYIRLLYRGEPRWKLPYAGRRADALMGMAQEWMQVWRFEGYKGEGKTKAVELKTKVCNEYPGTFEAAGAQSWLSRYSP